jgi:ATP-dependent Clp protease adaptor protein ClpS
MSVDTIIEKKTRTVNRNKNEEPGKYKVVVCNDDVTPVDFVISMLIGIFRYDEKSAVDLTLKIHNSGNAVAGIFSYEVAEQKGLDATNFARSSGYPLIIKVEPE